MMVIVLIFEIKGVIVDLWSVFPVYIANFLGCSASLSTWETHLLDSPIHAMQPNWQLLEKGIEGNSPVWGLQSITFHTVLSEAGTPWMAKWPKCLPAGKTTIAHANECFGEPLVHAQGIALYQIKSPLNESWIAQCAFTEEGYLQHLTFAKMHEWKLLNEKGEKQPVSDIQLPPQISKIGLSPAGASAPFKGWYEALLPAEHPMQPFYSKSEVRFVYREQGENFPKLGVTPADDEALVQWAWISEA